MKKNIIRTIMHIYTIFNLANVVMAFAFEFMRPFFGANAAMSLLGNTMFYLISAYSFLAIFGFLFSVFGAIYYFRGCLKWEERSVAYIYLMLSMINIAGIGYFIMLATATA